MVAPAELMGCVSYFMVVDLSMSNGTRDEDLPHQRSGTGAGIRIRTRYPQRPPEK